MMSAGPISTIHPLLCCWDTRGRRIPFSTVTTSPRVRGGVTEVSQLGRGPGSAGHPPAAVPAPSQLLQPVFLAGCSLPLHTDGLCLPLASPPLPQEPVPALILTHVSGKSTFFPGMNCGFPSAINHFPSENSIGGLETHRSFIYWGMTWHAGTRPRGWRLRDGEGSGEKPRGELPSRAGNCLPPGPPPPGQTPSLCSGLTGRGDGDGEENSGNATCFEPLSQRGCPLARAGMSPLSLPAPRGSRTPQLMGLGGPKAEEAPPAWGGGTTTTCERFLPPSSIQTVRG